MPPNIPRIKIHQVDFHWDGSDFRNSAIPITPDSAGWTRLYRSYAAYSLADIRETVEAGKLQIKARFQCSSGKGRYQIRARMVPLDIKDIFTGKVVEDYPGLDALGEVSPTTVYFNDTSFSVYRGKNTLVPFLLEDVNFPEMGVGIYDINLLWEFRVLNESKTEEEGKDIWRKPWLKIGMTNHRIFILLDTPKFPWTPYQLPDIHEPPPRALPLISKALTIACNWARGASDKTEAAKMIADKLYDSGLLEYNVNMNYYEEGNFDYTDLGGENPGERHYLATFNLSKMLERLLGGQGNGEKANCMDCALTVVTLANILGCNLQPGRLQGTPSTDRYDPDLAEKNRFPIHEIKAIGLPDLEASKAGLEEEDGLYFTYHSVAWTAPEDSESEEKATFSHPDMVIFDASLRFPAGTDENGAESFDSAAGLPFYGENGYRARLAREEGIDKCLPQPETVFRFQII